jgi:hypothetical protein
MATDVMVVEFASLPGRDHEWYELDAKPCPREVRIGAMAAVTVDTGVHYGYVSELDVAGNGALLSGRGVSHRVAASELRRLYVKAFLRGADPVVTISYFEVDPAALVTGVTVQVRMQPGWTAAVWVDNGTRSCVGRGPRELHRRVTPTEVDALEALEALAQRSYRRLIEQGLSQSAVMELVSRRREVLASRGVR